jgi:hypothetical protein
MLRLVSSLAALAAFGTTPLAFGGADQPYRAYEVGHVTALVPTAAGAHVEASLSGYGTVTGAYTGTLSYDVTVDLVTQIRSFTGQARITTASGDELFGEARGRNDEATPPFIYSGIFRITGGTGRFLNARATGRLFGYDPSQGEFTTFYDGQLGHASEAGD